MRWAKQQDAVNLIHGKNTTSAEREQKYYYKSYFTED